ncbi:phosphoethanolamine transferase [Pseudoxanthomonas yeongjuensis]|uniref:phosphoethanolamine transferase n=1 Tax=Pseudoxanthomonas yeongjuensis TaxID=377616 RepID=UPI001FE346DB|nr:phosphoethanolamine--lipid A transferase [Pseudoxanthomonas yeongjuensis]
MPAKAAAATTTWWQWRPQISGESLVLLSALYFSLFSNGAFWHAAIAHPLAQWRFVLSLFLVVTALHALLLGLVTNRWIAKPLLTALLLATAVASHYMSAYGVYLDADMLRNVLHTDSKESGELLSPRLLIPLAWSLLPIVLLWRVRLRRRRWPRALAARAGFLLAMALVAACGVMLSSQDFSTLFRSQREVRYLVAPANYVVSLSNVLLSSPPGPKKALLPIGLDARQAHETGKPRLLLLVVGETARARNWGLNGYARQTTPELARIPGLINFPQVTACGSSTEVSLPCMFSPYGRRDYDEGRIRDHQSLLHVLDHAGIATLWRDNQSGCKGVCDKLPIERLDDARDTELCNGKRCLDGILLKGLQAQLSPVKGDRVVVLHQLGNHGPNYFERYPPAFKRFTPTCDNPELGRCEREHIVNAYDNALLYTDHVLAQAIGFLRQQTAYDTALIYVSDHGESLGEKGLFLHGVPYAIAPQEQTRVPMVMWFSPGFIGDSGLDLDCLRRRAAQPASHDNLFPSVLGLLQVRTEVYRPADDLFAACRAPAWTG